ncbi:hypothetical protein OQA88_12813 [Cercophora sp. LCS_1]
MEPWKDVNYYTTNATIMVELMNASTAEWSIGFFPPNVFAIPGSLNESYSFPPDALVIENVSQGKFGELEIERAIFGGTSGVVLACALAWLAWRHFWVQKLLSPRGSSAPAESVPGVFDAERSGGSATGESNMLELGWYGFGSDSFVEDEKFKAELSIYYDDVKTEPELYKKNLAVDDVVAEDVVAGTELLRRLYDLQLKIWSEKGSHEVTQEQRDLDEAQRDALLADYRKLVSTWVRESDRIGWSEEEAKELTDLTKMLGGLPGRGRQGAAARG